MTAVATVISNVTTATHRKMINQGVPSSVPSGTVLELIFIYGISVYWVTYIDSLKTPCHPGMEALLINSTCWVIM